MIGTNRALKKIYQIREMNEEIERSMRDMGKADEEINVTLCSLFLKALLPVEDSQQHCLNVNNYSCFQWTQCSTVEKVQVTLELIRLKLHEE